MVIITMYLRGSIIVGDRKSILMVLFLVVGSIPVITWSEEKENSLKVKIKVIENDGTITRIAPSSIESIKDNIG